MEEKYTGPYLQEQDCSNIRGIKLMIHTMKLCEKVVKKLSCHVKASQMPTLP